jgi:hypothetical protein
MSIPRVRTGIQIAAVLVAIITTADDIAYFDGTRWRPIGSNGAGDGPVNAAPNALSIFKASVYAGGVFTSAGGDSLAQCLAAHSLRLPDTSIGATKTGTFVGNNVYSPTGVGEVRKVTVTRGHSVTSYVKIQNDGLEAAPFTIEGIGGATGITAHYYRGTTNITAAVRAGTYNTGDIAARSSILLRLVVSVANSSASAATIYTFAESRYPPPTPDAVRLVVTATN